MNAPEMTQYLRTVQDHLDQTQDLDSLRQALLPLVEKHLTTSTSPFLLGEKAFYLGHYAQAIKHYLQEHSLPESTFYAYRATAYLYERRGNSKKAFFFANKALKHLSKDPFTNKINSLSQTNCQPSQKTPTFTKTTSSPLSLKAKQLEELAQIFQEPHQKSSL